MLVLVLRKVKVGAVEERLGGWRVIVYDWCRAVAALWRRTANNRLIQHELPAVSATRLPRIERPRSERRGGGVLARHRFWQKRWVVVTRKPSYALSNLARNNKPETPRSPCLASWITDTLERIFAPG